MSIGRQEARRWFREALAMQTHLQHLNRVDGTSVLTDAVIGDRFSEVPLLLITPDVGKVLDAAVGGWDRSEKCMAEDMGEFPEGMAYFPEGGITVSPDPLELTIEAMAWRPAWFPGCDVFAVAVFRAARERGIVLQPITFGSGTAEANGGPLLRVLWRFLQQRVAVSSQPRPGYLATGVRQDRPIETLRVVTLRRTRPKPVAGEGESSREYSHRWVVHGFWRNQWYPSLGAHRQKWIEDYVKGPEDKPLIVKDTVYMVKR